MKLDLVIDGNNIDLYGDEPINLTYSIADIRSIFTRDTTFSQNFKLPGTPNNNQVFSHLFNIQANSTAFNPNQLVRAQLYKDSVLIMDGWFQLLDVEVDDLNRQYIYNGTLTDQIYNFYNNIKDKTLNDINWFKNNIFPSFTTGDQFLDYIESSWSNFSLSPNTTHFTFPLVDINYGWSYDELTRNNPISAEQLPVGTRVKKIVDEIFFDAGYQYQSNFFNSEYFKNLIIVSNDNGQMTVEYNIGLNLLFDFTGRGWQEKTYYYAQLVAISLTNPGGRVIEEIEDFQDVTPIGGTQKKVITLNGNANVYANETLYVKIKIDPTVVQLSQSTQAFNQFIYLESGSTMELKYIEPNFSGYTFKVQTDYIQHGEVVTGYQPSLANGTAGLTGSREVSWIVGWSVYFPASPTSYIGHVISNPGGLYDTVEGYYSVTPRPQLSLYVPDNIKQSDFLVWLVNAFNLYIDWDNINERVIIEPRDEYLQLNDTIRDWTKILDISKNQNIKLVNEDQPRNYLFTYTDDDDNVNTLYKDTYKDAVYGQYSYIFDKKILTDAAKIQLGFAPSPLCQMFNSREILLPQIYKNDTRHEKIEFKPRLLYWNGLQYLDTESIWIKSDLPATFTSYFDPTAKFNALITNSSANNFSASQSQCYSPSCSGGYCKNNYFLNRIYFQTDTLSSPNYNTSTSVFTAINQGVYDIYCVLRPTVTLTATGGYGGYVQVRFYITKFNASNQQIGQYLINSLTAQNALAGGSPVVVGNQIDLFLSNLSMNAGDFLIVEAFYDSGICGQNVTFNWNLNISSGYILSVRNQIQVSNVRRYNYYPYASEFVGKIGQETETIMFGIPEKIFYSSSLSNGYPDLGLFKKYWSGYLHEIESSESKIYTAYFNLTQEDISTFKFNDLIHVDGTYFRINKIFYNPSGDDTTKVELLKLDSLSTPIENQMVITPLKKVANLNVQGVNYGNNNVIGSSTLVLGSNNTLLRTSNSLITGTNNTIGGTSTNVQINGSNNTVTNGVTNVSIVGSSNFVALSNVTILNGSNNNITATQILSSGFTGTTTATTIDPNITLIGVSNYSGTPTSNSVIVPNLIVQSGLTINGFNVINSGYIIVKNNYTLNLSDYNKTIFIDDFITTASTITINLLTPPDGAELTFKEIRSSGGTIGDIKISGNTGDTFWNYPTTSTYALFGGDNRAVKYKYLSSKKHWYIISEYST